ncbi:MAG: TIR domain-containing protein [Solirubrobacterales bacterium]|nr:TIR domain-containing protein [Solirubrobacterales bacterium]
MSTTTPKVFISYRREDTAGHAGRLYDSMAARFGEGRVFVDVDLEPGIDFVQRITEAIGLCQVLLVIIGPRWTTLADDAGEPRIADRDDFVRLEVETALRRAEVTVIPVLVAGAKMPDADDLPEGLRALARRNALELSDLRWRYDVGRLNARLDQLVAETSTLQAAPGGPAAEPAAASTARLPSPTRLPSTARLFIDGLLVAGAAALLARWLADPIDPADQVTEAGKIATAILRRTVTWAVLGASLGAWLTLIRGERQLLANRIVLGLGVGALAGALGGAIIALPQYLSDLDVTREAIDAISIGAFAVSGALIGALVGALWIPRSLAAGFLAGLAAGALVRLLWNVVAWSGGSAFEESLGTGIQCLLIVGLVLVALRALSVEPRSAVGAGGAGSRSGAPG